MTKRAIGTIVPLAVSYVYVGNPLVVIANERNGIVVSCNEMANIKGNFEVRRHCQCLLKAFRRGELVRVDQIVVIMHGNEHAVLLGEWD